MSVNLNFLNKIWGFKDLSLLIFLLVVPPPSSAISPIGVATKQRWLQRRQTEVSAARSRRSPVAGGGSLRSGVDDPQV